MPLVIGYRTSYRRCELSVIVPHSNALNFRRCFMSYKEKVLEYPSSKKRSFTSSISRTEVRCPCENSRNKSEFYCGKQPH